MLDASDLGPARQEVSPGRLLRCKDCRLAFRRMRPSAEDLSRLYREADSRLYDAEFQARSRTALRHLRIVRRYVTGGRLLDVGCASGAFLRAAAEAGWKVVGVEPSAALCERAANVLDGRGELIRGALEEACLPAASFDVVTLWDVLEHVPDPAGFLHACSLLVGPGGYVFANVPDLDSLPARLLGPHWPLLLPEHLSYFNRKSLRVCGQRAGLTCVGFGHRPASFSIDYILYRLSQHAAPGAATLRRAASLLHIGHLIVPVPMGELYTIWKR